MKKIILGVFVFLIVLIIAAPFLIPTKFISDKISAAVGQNLHKKTVIQSVRFSIFPRIGIKVSGLEIGTARTDDYFVTLGSLFVELEWKPLLKKQVSISQIALSKPVIEFYTTLESPPAEKTEKRGSPGIELNIDSLKIDDLSFTMFDEKLNPTFLVSGLSEKLSFNYSADGTATIQGTTIIPTLAVTTPMGLLGKNTKIEIKKDILINDKDLNIQELKISLGSLPISLEGKILGYSTQTPDVDLKFSGGPADIENIVGLIPSKMLPSDLKNVESKGNLHIAGNLQGKINTANAGQSIQASNFSLTMNLSNGSVRAPQLPKPMTNIGFSVSVDPRKAEVKNFAADFGGSMIRLSATVSDYLKNPIFDFDTKSTLALTDLSALHQDMPAKNLQGSFVANINASGAAKNPMSTVLNGSVVMKEISFDYPDMNYKIEHFNSTLKLASNNVVIQNLGLLINGSDFSGSGRIDNPMAMMNEDKNSLLKFSINASSKNIDADKLMPPPSDDETTELPPSFYKLDGDIKATIAKLTFNKLDMTNAVGNIGLHKGLVTFNPLSVKTFGGIVAMTGNVNLKNKKKPTFDLDTQLTNIAVDKALNYADNVNKLLKLDNSLKANIGLKAKSKGELTQTFDLNIASLDSVGSFSLNDASIQNHPIQKAFSKYFKSDQFDKISISQWTQAFSVEKGKLNVNNLNFGAKEFSFNINGWQSLEGKNDFAIDAKLPQSIVSKITDKLPSPVASLIASQKQFTLPLTVSGETTNPSVGINNEKLTAESKDLLKSQLKAETGKLANDAKSTLKDMINENSTNKKTSPQKKDLKKDVNSSINKIKKLF
jgi:hypothetical protein